MKIKRLAPQLPLNTSRICLCPVSPSSKRCVVLLTENCRLRLSWIFPQRLLLSLSNPTAIRAISIPGKISAIFFWKRIFLTALSSGVSYGNKWSIQWCKRTKRTHKITLIEINCVGEYHIRRHEPNLQRVREGASAQLRQLAMPGHSSQNWKIGAAALSIYRHVCYY